MISKKLREFLDKNKVYYGQQSHARTYSAETTAAAAQIPPEEMAKTVIVRLDGELAMAVLKSNERLDLKKLKTLSGAQEIQLVREQDFEAIFEDCERGAMPPFGNLYDLKEFADVSLGDDDTIAFNGGNHSEVVVIPYKVFARLAKPLIGRIAS